MSTHRCEKLLLALIMAYERSHWPAAMRATPANFSARGVSRCESRIGDSGRRTDEEEPARVLPAAVLGREERIFEDVLEDAGAVCDVVQLPVVEEVRCRGGSIVSAHAHASREVRGDDLTGHGELARVVHGRDDELGEVKEAPAREVEAQLGRVCRGVPNALREGLDVALETLCGPCEPSRGVEGEEDGAEGPARAKDERNGGDVMRGRAEARQGPLDGQRLCGGGALCSGWCRRPSAAVFDLGS